jgi:hypothetical protein
LHSPLLGLACDNESIVMLEVLFEIRAELLLRFCACGLRDRSKYSCCLQQLHLTAIFCAGNLRNVFSQTIPDLVSEAKKKKNHLTFLTALFILLLQKHKGYIGK